jgi:hypothetical protein
VEEQTKEGAIGEGEWKEGRGRQRQRERYGVAKGEGDFENRPLHILIGFCIVFHYVFC